MENKKPAGRRELLPATVVLAIKIYKWFIYEQAVYRVFYFNTITLFFFH